MNLNTEAIKRWFADNGDNTHNITYDLNENSKVMDLGGYTGVWANQIINKYNPFVYILEPIPSFFEIMKEKFKNNQKVNLLNVGVSTEEKDGVIYLNSDGSSTNKPFSTIADAINVKFKTIDKVLEEFKINQIDLLQINIEGDEYDLLDYMIDNNLLGSFKNIQVQFHLGVENDVLRREKIRQSFIKNNFEINFDYPFVWESWRQKI